MLEVVDHESVDAVRSTRVRDTPQTARLGSLPQHQNRASQRPIRAHIASTAGHLASNGWLTQHDPHHRQRASVPLASTPTTDPEDGLIHQPPGCTMAGEVMPMREPLRTS
jgi:hypothetical protein